MLFKVQIDRSQPHYFISTEVDRNTPWRHVSSETRMPSGKNKLERDSKFITVTSSPMKKMTNQRLLVFFIKQHFIITIQIWQIHHQAI